MPQSRFSRWLAILGVLASLAAPLHPSTACAQTISKTTAPASKPSSTGAKPAGALLDLNTASVPELKSLPGIGDAYAKRIVDGRPFDAKNQLVSRGVVPQATYDKIKDKVVAKHQAK